MSIRQELAQFIARLKFNDLPQDVIEHTKLCIMDQIGVTVAGASLSRDEFADVAKFMSELGGKQESSIIGIKGKCSCINAVLVNTISAVATGLDGLHHNSVIHLPGALIPAAISVAEKQGANGKDLILAIVIGSEVAIRVSYSLGPRNAYARGFHPTSITAPFACAAATGKLLGLGEAQLSEALSIAGVQAAGSSIWAGARWPTSWLIQIGRASQSGVLAAMLAQLGITGIDELFEDQRGYLKAHSDSPDAAKLTEGLGQRYEILGISLKKYGFGIYTFTSVEALLDILQKYGIAANEIAEIMVKLPSVVVPLVGFPEYPVNFGSAQVSTRYALAATTYLRDEASFSIEACGLKNRKDKRISDLFTKIKVSADPELDKTFPQKHSCIIALRTKDGRSFSQRNDGPVKGDPDNPLSLEELEAKFHKLTISLLGDHGSDKALNAIKQLDRLDDVSKLVDMLIL